MDRHAIVLRTVVLKLIISNVRIRIKQERLIFLTFFSLENDVTQYLNLNHVISNLVKKKLKRVKL